MPTICLEALRFHYESPFAPVFRDVELRIDTSWRAGLVGRNGRGKTTLLDLVAGRLQPQQGRIVLPTEPLSFTPASPGLALPTREVVRNAVAPFSRWEREMDAWLEEGTPAALERYGELALEYERLGGYVVDHRIDEEWAAMGLDPGLLLRPHASLSGGEQTRASIAGLFIREGGYPLIDEPTNHLDLHGREQLADYLGRKPGFLLVSHDRALLDRCCDHMVAIERDRLRVHTGGYTTLREQQRLEEEHETRERERLSREVRTLKQAARERRDWSGAREKTKRGAADKGYVGHRAAKMMKRALHVEGRAQARLEERQALVRIPEKKRELKLATRAGPSTLLAAEGLSVEAGGRVLIDHLDLRIERGERIAIEGPNGSGKTLLLQTLCGERAPGAGRVTRTAGVRLCRAHQRPHWQTGRLADHLRGAGVDETRFRNVLGVLGMEGEAFDRPLETFSEGERKKADLCLSFLAPADLWVWDEPLNYLDIESREQIEAVLLRDAPTLIFVEHDAWFCERVATRRI
jgi:lincosamide and streptogramin A transport system ATP-binding/permease protein